MAAVGSTCTWTYSEEEFGPKYWHQRYTGGETALQSPINIERVSVVSDVGLGSLWHTYEPTSNGTLTNDGRTLQITFCNNRNVLSGGPLTDEYQLAMIRFHWAADDAAGSEHRVDDEGYPLEVQLLHWNKNKFSNIGEALRGEQGVCILAVFFEVGNEDHEELRKIIQLLSKDEHKGCFSTEIKATIDPSSIIPATLDYWTYQGSLTTPPLTENVTWIIFRSQLIMSQNQIDVFRNIRNSIGELITNNSRPLCPTNNRIIKASVDSNNNIEQ